MSALSLDVNSLYLCFQILYLYYLLGFKFMRDYDTVDDILEHDNSRKRTRRQKFRKTTSILNNLPPEKVRQVRRRICPRNIETRISSKDCEERWFRTIK